ncbi:hypothetical protein DL96DRAFT_1614272 [Flagelloscypha sp. PMI_526]|nr:hypothetical protein DL96DRAFT_1614272 [Flagelloscypha sp. PMI_526]
MGCWEIYCFITGIAAGSNVDGLLGVWEEDEIDDIKHELQELTTGLVEKLVATQNPNLPLRDELETLLLDALTILHTKLPSDDDGYSMAPDSWGKICDEVAVFGTFDGDEAPTLRICSGYDAYGGFSSMLGQNGEWTNTRVQVNTFLDRKCWCYLQTWLRLPREPEISWGDELWKAIKKDVSNGGYENIHGNFDYGIICFTWGSQGQDTFKGDGFLVSEILEYMCLDTVPHLTEAICAGLRGRDLGPAVLADFQGWIFEAVDIWPTRPEGELATPRFQFFRKPFQGQNQKSKFLALPVELMVNILSRISIAGALDVSSTCKHLRNQIVRDELLSMLIRDMIQDGALQWIQPCSLIENEVENANAALLTWLPDKDCTNPLQSPHFPILSFLHTCFIKSGSMKNRHRIWGMIKQLERRWVAYQKGEEIDDDKRGEAKM